MKFKATKVMAGVLACAVSVSVLAGCGGGGGNYDNDNNPLIFSTQALDGVFNPFFATSATDGNVAGLTQIGMLANDEQGNVTYGDNEAVVVKDMQVETTGSGETQKTEYKFVLKNNVQFSNGSYLTIKDVLFNLYVYLDPAYTGSSTIYSTDIVGLKAYRTQSQDESEQDAFLGKFQLAAQTRINALAAAADQVFEDSDVSYDSVSFKAALQDLQDGNKGSYPHIVQDYEKTVELFRKELEQDYSNAVDSYADTVFQDETGREYRGMLHSDVEMFLYNENVLTWNKKTASIEGWPGDLDGNGALMWTKEQALDYVFETNMPDNIAEVITYWMTAGELYTYLTNAEMEAYFQDPTHARQIKSISGIKFANMSEPVTVNGTTYAVPTYENGSKNHVTDGNEVLSITINKIDPKAVWNFAFTVAPMYYYSDEAHINAFDYAENFGVEYGSQTFLDTVVGAPAKNGVPVGAGPYVAAKESGGTDNVASGDFFNGSMVFFERNDYYVMGAPKIKKVRYMVSEQNHVLSALYTGEMDYVEPNAKTDTFNEVRGKEKDGIGNKQALTAGYGYIGINAGKVPNLKVRQAIMHCINPQMTADYYGTHASTLYRSMTKANWVYNLALENKTSYYPFIEDPIPEDLSVVNPDYADFVTSHNKQTGETLTKEEQEEFIRGLIEGEGYQLNQNGVYVSANGSDTLKYKFTVVGAEQDHPAWPALWKAHLLLNQWGFDIDVKTDPQGLVKLNDGSLTVWAAAWGSTIDPDMYQVYHKDSTATSVLNWGYRQILLNAGNRYYREVRILDDLAVLIDRGREIDDSTDAGKRERAAVYAQALDKVMELAVELPTYQREDLFVYNKNKIDESTLYQNPTPYKGPTSDIHTVSLNVAK